METSSKQRVWVGFLPLVKSRNGTGSRYPVEGSSKKGQLSVPFVDH